MTIFQGYEMPIVSIGGGRPIKAVFFKPNGRDVRDLTGYFGWFCFGYPGANPHVCRDARVDGANGCVWYDEIFGDEYPLASDGSGECMVQAHAMHPDYGAASARGFLVVSSEVMRRWVRP